MTEDWFTYSETELANAVPDSDKAEDQAASGSGQSSGDALSTATDVKECCVCGEKFDEYWDEDDDVWKLKDCVVEDNKTFHRYCKSDSAQFQAMEEDIQPSTSQSTYNSDLLTNTESSSSPIEPMEQGASLNDVLGQLFKNTSDSDTNSSSSAYINDDQRQHLDIGVEENDALKQKFLQQLSQWWVGDVGWGGGDVKCRGDFFLYVTYNLQNSPLANQ